jgi:hypothetical protein
MSLSVANVRSRIAAGLLTDLQPSGWSQSRYPADLFGSDTRSLAHLSYAVGVTSTAPMPLERQSARGLERGTHALTRVVVRWSHVLRADAALDSYDAALREEQRLIAACLAVDADPELAVRWGGVPSRTVAGDGTYLLGVVDLEVYHRFPLVVPTTV